MHKVAFAYALLVPESVHRTLLWRAIRGVLEITHNTISLDMITSMHFAICTLSQKVVPYNELVIALRQAFDKGYIRFQSVVSWLGSMKSYFSRVLGFRAIETGLQSSFRYYDTFAHRVINGVWSAQFCQQTGIHQHRVTLHPTADRSVQTCLLLFF